MKKGLLLSIAIVSLIAVALWQSVPPGDLLERIPFGNMALDARGNLLRMSLAGDGRYRLRIALDQIAPAVVEATLKYEDQYFYAHPGVNPFSMLRAVASLAGERRMGASTITMQVARLLYGLKTGDPVDKLRQIWLALAIELHHSKADILEAYFNLAPYGGNVEGIEAASRIYFHKAAGNLTPLESIALAVVPQNPGSRLPGRGKDFEAAYARLARFMAIDEEHARLRIYGQKDLPFRAPHLSMQLLAENGATPVKTYLEADLHSALERSLKHYVKREYMHGLNNAAALIVHCPDMRVVALAGSANFHSASVSGQIDGTKIRRSPGSTLKPFIYALALDQGLIHPGSILPDTPRSFGGYDPGNFDRQFRGPVSARDALRTSRNLPAIVLAEQLKSPGLFEFLENAHVDFPKCQEYYGLALVLGGAEVTMRELAGLYAMLANNGIWKPLRYKAGHLEPGQRLLSPEAAWITLQMLARPEAEIGAQASSAPVYYKTGTSNGMRDAWTAGIVGQYALIVWVGNFDNSSNPYLVGAVAALPLFEEISRSIASLRHLTSPLTLPSALNLVSTPICVSTGDLYRGQCEVIDDIWFIPGVSPIRDTGILRTVWINEESGTRSCEPGSPGAREVWWEFWPSEMSQIFARAGIHKPGPPPWDPQCSNARMDNGPKQPGAGKGYSGPPRITLPKKNVIYQHGKEETGFRLPLQASIDADSDRVYWYADGKYLGSAKGGEIIFWHAQPGVTNLLAVDSNGKSARQECRIGVAF